MKEKLIIYRAIQEKERVDNSLFEEASTGFEPVIRVLQTLALTL